MVYCTQFSRDICGPLNIAKMSILARKQDKHSIVCSLVVEQPQPLLDNDYILSKTIWIGNVCLMMYCTQFSRRFSPSKYENVSFSREITQKLNYTFYRNRTATTIVKQWLYVT